MKLRVVVFMVLSLCLFSPVRGEDPVHFADMWLKISVEDQLWITDPTPTDMLGLTSLTASLRHVSSLTGLEHATNLESLDVSENKIHDVSPLAGLSKLRFLVLNNNQITDLSPLSGLYDLEHLDIHENGLSDLSVLAGLSNLRHLNLHENEISDISALSGLSCLETLIINLNQVQDLSALSGLSLLSILNLESNCISDISALSSLSSLRDLNLRGNQIIDISPLTSLTTLESLYLGGNPRSETACNVCVPQILANSPGVQIEHECGPFAVSISCGIGGAIIEPGEGLFLCQYDEPIRLEAKADPYFRFTGWSGTLWSGQNPQVIQVRQDCQVQAVFVSILHVLHVDDDAPGDPRPGDSTAGDPGENGTVEHPFDRIQEAIEVAAEGATIFVHPGTYTESIDSLGKGITITGQNPADPNTMAWPVIQGLSGGPVAIVAGGPEADCVLHGLVLTGGRGRLAGAVQCSRSRLVMSNCLVAGNRASDPTSAAIYCADGSTVTVTSCTIVDNTTGLMGTVIASGGSLVTVTNSILWGHPWREVTQLDSGQASVSYSVVAGGWPGPGCMDTDPLFAAAGYWANPNNQSEVLSSYDPAASWVMGDYHLQSRRGRWDPVAGQWVQDAVTSPCIDAGDPAGAAGAEPIPNGGIINLGAYGGTSHASRSDR